MTPRLALVLAGGGARGAYEAGVLRFILGDLPKRIGHPIAADLICGTSVGAINGAAIAAWNGDPVGTTELSAFWNNLACGDVYRFVAMDLLRSPMRMFRNRPSGELAWVDAGPLHTLMREEFPWTQLHEVIDSGRLQALVLTATEVVTGRCVQFIDGKIEPDSMHSHYGIRRVFGRMQADHVLASCAIPFLFPPISIDEVPFVDGSLRQNTPLSPAVRMGAKGLLVVGTKRPKTPEERDEEDAKKDPSTAFLLGKALNALLLDPVHTELRYIDLINDILQCGEDAYGPEFLGRINAGLEHKLSRQLRPIHTLQIHPSEDLGKLASTVWNPKELQATKGTKFMLSTVAGESEEADLLSYLMFDATYTRVIEDLGYSDAKNQETEIIRFLEQTFS
ncbi:MAG: patatin-like phospholipase family protein [Myxococcota bacterium]